MATLDSEDLENIADAVWDEILTGTTHNIQNSGGKRLRDIASQAIHTDTAQSAAVGSNQIELAVAASSIDGAYDPSMITIIDGTGTGQTRLIYQYEGSTRIATVDRNWKINPDVTSEYIIFSHPGREHVNEGLSGGGTINTITLNTLASTIDDIYNFQTIFLRSGTGEDQIGLIIAYDGTTKTATIEGEWAITPDTTTGYAMLPNYYNPITANAASFNDKIVVDIVNGTAGIMYPQGTRRKPVNNLVDAETIGVVNGIRTFYLKNTNTLQASDNINDRTLIGENVLSSVVILPAGISTDKTTFTNMIVTGTVNGTVFMDRVGLDNISGFGSNIFPSIFNECIFRVGTAITFGTGFTTPNRLYFMNCTSVGSQAENVIIDMNFSTSTMSLEGFNGGFTLKNFTGGQNVSIEGNGKFILDSSCTNGSIDIRGDYELINNSTLIVNDGMSGTSDAIWKYDITSIVGNALAGHILNLIKTYNINKMTWDENNSRFIIYDDAGTTPIQYVNVTTKHDSSVVLNSQMIANRDGRIDV